MLHCVSILDVSAVYFFVVCFTKLWASWIIQYRMVSWSINRKGSWRTWAWPNQGTILPFALRDWWKPWKHSFRVASVSAEIREAPLEYRRRPPLLGAWWWIIKACRKCCILTTPASVPTQSSVAMPHDNCSEERSVHSISTWHCEQWTC